MLTLGECSARWPAAAAAGPPNCTALACHAMFRLQDENHETTLPHSENREQVAQLSQRNRDAGIVEF